MIPFYFKSPGFKWVDSALESGFLICYAIFSYEDIMGSSFVGIKNVLYEACKFMNVVELLDVEVFDTRDTCTGAPLRVIYFMGDPETIVS